MTARKRIRPGEPVPVSFTARERKLIVELNFAEGPLFDQLERTPPQGAAEFLASLDDIEELQGYVAAEANHSKNRKLQLELDHLCARLQEILDSYEETDEPVARIIAFPETRRPKLR
jgi:hypothetical protein